MERRQSRRFAFEAPVEIEYGSAVLRGTVSEISEGGMFIKVDDPLWIGASFSAQVTLDSPHRLDCIVRRVDPGRGMGVSWTAPDDAARERLGRLLADLGNR
jgi:hypothetical protein